MSYTSGKAKMRGQSADPIDPMKVDSSEYTMPGSLIGPESDTVPNPPAMFDSQVASNNKGTGRMEPTAMALSGKRHTLPLNKWNNLG